MRIHELRRSVRVFAVILFLRLVSDTAAVRAADVSFGFDSSDATPQGLRSVSLYPSGTFTNGAGRIITRDRVSRTTDVAGNVTVSNVYGGDYRGELQGTFTVTTNWYHFPVTNGLINAADYIGPPTNSAGVVAYSTAQSDARYVAQSAGVGSNETFSGMTTISGTNAWPTRILVPDGGVAFGVDSFFDQGQITDSGEVIFHSFTATDSFEAAGHPGYFGDGEALTNINAANVIGNGSGITGIKATSINPLVQIYTATGIYCAQVQTNNSYVVSGASGSHNNSSGTPVDFSGANGTYVWNPVGKGNGFNNVTNVGVFTNSGSPNWVLSFQFIGANPEVHWVIYNTNTWIYTLAGNPTNSVLIGGLALGRGAFFDPFSVYLPDMTGSNFWNYYPDMAGFSGSIHPAYTTNGFPITATVDDPVDGLMHFPKVGPTQTAVRRYNVPPPNQSPEATVNASVNGILKLTNGCGVVRGIEIMPSGFAGRYRSNYWLQIFPDYGTNTTVFANVNSNLMTFNVPLTSLASCKWDNTNGLEGLVSEAWSTEFVDVLTAEAFISQGMIKLALKTPIPFTNGIFIRVVDSNLNIEPVVNFYSTVNYEVDTSGLLNYPFRDWRLHGVLNRFREWDPSPYGTIPTDWSNAGFASMFSATNCAGVVVGVWAGLAGLTLPNSPMETANWEWIADGKYPPGQAEGEDVFFNPYEFIAPPPVLQRTFGTVTRATDTADAYRQFSSGFEFSWQHDIRAQVTTAGANTNFWGDIATLYYSVPR
jgi:hypothetical protein